MTITVIIPTWNEGQDIGSLVKFVVQHGGPSVGEVLVVDGGSTDDTVNVARRAGARTLTCAEPSRARQMNLGAQQATGDVLYFAHADVKLATSFSHDILEAINEGYDAGCYRYVFDSSHPMLKINGYFTRFDRLMCRGGDQTLFVRRSVFENLNGYNERFSIMEDYDFLLRLRQKHTFKIIPKDIVVSARKYQTNGWLRVQLANLTVFMMFFLKQSPERMKKVYKKMLNYR